MSLEAKDDPSIVSTRRARGAIVERRTLRFFHALLLVALGGWLLVRALQTLWPTARLPESIGLAGAFAPAFAVAMLFVGILLLGVATTLPYGRAWAWAIAALGALAALALIAAAWLMSGAGDWPGALLALPAVVLLAAPSVRELYLNE